MLTLDALDTSPASCEPQQCPDASSQLPLSIPSAFLGETLDASTQTGQACAPQADNFQTFYARAKSPSYEITLRGANYYSFIEDLVGCGATCSFCQPATLSQSDALTISLSYSVAFFERTLRNRAAYDSWLIGADAQRQFVDTDEVSIAFK